MWLQNLRRKGQICVAYFTLESMEYSIIQKQSESFLVSSDVITDYADYFNRFAATATRQDCQFSLVTFRYEILSVMNMLYD